MFNSDRRPVDSVINQDVNAGYPGLTMRNKSIDCFSTMLVQCVCGKGQSVARIDHVVNENGDL